jgi:hypothetical protein
MKISAWNRSKGKAVEAGSGPATEHVRTATAAIVK